MAVVLYLVLAALCWARVAQAWRVRKSSGQPLTWRFWGLFALGVTALGINKQADFQTWLIGLGRFYARAEGLFQYRRSIQAVFVAVLAVAIGAAVVALWRAARRAHLAERLVLAGAAALLGFTFLRAATFNHVRLAGALPGPGVSMLGVELVILVFLCVAVWCVPDSSTLQ